MARWRLMQVSLGVLLALLLGVGAAWATSFTWDGDVSSAWNVGHPKKDEESNWDPTQNNPSYPQYYSDQATIDDSTNNPVQLSKTIKLGGATTVLTIGSGAGSNALDHCCPVEVT